MKRLLKFALLAVISLFFVTACESKPDPAPEPEKPTPVVVDEPTSEPIPEQVPEPTPESEPEPVLTVNYKEYTVKKGDTLSQIAERFYGNKDRAYFFPIIIAYTLDSFATLNTSEESVSVSFDDPDVIEPGTVLRIPDFDEFMVSPMHVAAVKPLFERIARHYENKSRHGVAKMIRDRAERLGTE